MPPRLWTSQICFLARNGSAPESRAVEEAVTDREVKRRDEECAPKLKDDEGEYEADRIVMMRQMEEENYSLEKELIAALRELGESRRIIEKLVSTLDFSDKTRFKSLPEMTIRDLEGRNNYPNGH